MPDPPPKPDAFLVLPKDAFQLVLLFSHIHATCLLPFLRFGQGVDVPGVVGVIALVVMGVYAESMRSTEMVRFIQVWIAALIVMRLRRDRFQHSQYLGMSYLVKLPLAKWTRNPETCAKAIEPFFCLAVGMLLKRWSEPVGNFVTLGFVSLTVIQLVHWLMERRIEVEIRNATIQGQRMSGRR